MLRSSSGRVALLLAVTALLSSISSLMAAPHGHGMAIWPAGFAIASVVVAPRRFAPFATLAVFLLAITTVGIARPGEVALGYAIGIVVEAAVARMVLVPDRDGVWTLRTDTDLSRWLFAGVSVGTIAGIAGGLTAAWTGFGNPGVVALANGTAQLASLVVFLPIFARLPEHGAAASRGESALQWTALVVIGSLALVRTEGPPLAFLFIPVLAWAALRRGPLVAIGQLILTMATSVIVTNGGSGPFAASAARFGLDSDQRAVLLAVYAASCALIVVPLVVRVGQHIDIARTAAAERDTLERIVASTTGIAIIGTDPEGRVTLFNPGAERLLGWTAAEMLGGTTHVLHSEAQWRAKAEEIGTDLDYRQAAQRLMEPDMAGTDLGFIRKDGAERMHSITMSRIVDDRGHVVGFLSTSEDITERLATQQALEQALEQMRELDTLKDAFVSSVSHELRTPITSISGYLELLGDGSLGTLTDAQKRAVAKVANNSDRLLGLIDDLLVLSRVHETGLHGEESLIDLRAVVDAACAVVLPSVETASLELDLDLPVEPVQMLGNRQLLERVVLNLVANAVKFTPAGGRVGVVLESCQDGARLVVTDTGIGIPERELPRLFSRFFRSSLAQRAAIPGSGLGLSIVHAAVQQYGGRIEVTSTVGVGSRFEVFLPATPPTGNV